MGDAYKIGGSPRRLDETLKVIFLLVIYSALLITSFTEYPLPEPRL